MPLDPMLFKKFHKPGSDVPVPAPKPASPPPEKESKFTPVTTETQLEVETEKDIVEVLEEGGFKVAFDIPAREPPVEGRGNAPETQADDSGMTDEEFAEMVEGVATPIEEPIDSKEIAVFEAPKADAGRVFQDRLNQLDSLVQSELGISPYTIDVIRSHVKQIMMDLVTQPELDAILIDRDVHNVLAFIRHVKVDAAEVRDSAKVKKEKKITKDSKFRNFDLDLTALAGSLTKPSVGMGGGGGIPLSLEDLGKLK